MKEYIVCVQEGEDERSRWFFTCEAEDPNHAEEQALDHDKSIRIISVYERIS